MRPDRWTKPLADCFIRRTLVPEQISGASSSQDLSCAAEFTSQPAALSQLRYRWGAGFCHFLPGAGTRMKWPHYEPAVGLLAQKSWERKEGSGGNLEDRRENTTELTSDRGSSLRHRFQAMLAGKPICIFTYLLPNEPWEISPLSKM